MTNKEIAQSEKIETIRKATILANHPEMNFEQALESEYLVGKEIYDRVESHIDIFQNLDGVDYEDDDGNIEETHKDFIMSLVPLTLAMVMVMLEKAEKNGMICSTAKTITEHGFIVLFTVEGGRICEWQLTKDGKELTLEDRSEETINALYELAENYISENKHRL